MIYLLWAVIVGTAFAADPQYGAFPDLSVDATRRVLIVEYLPPLQGKASDVMVQVTQEADGREMHVGGRLLKVQRGKRVRTEFSIPSITNCLYRVQVTDGQNTSEEVKNLYVAAQRSPAKAQLVAELLRVPLTFVGSFLEHTSHPFMAPEELNGLFRCDLRSGTITLLHRVPAGSIDNPRMSPDGQQVAFVLKRQQVPSEVWRWHGNGELTTVARGWSPVWSPDGLRFYLLREDGLYSVAVQGGDPNRASVPADPPLAELLGPVRDGSGRLVGVSRLGSDSVQFWLIDPTTGGRTRLSYDDAYLWLPELSPDGTTLVRSEPEASGTAKLLLRRLSDGTLRVLTEGKGQDQSPSWSNDGTAVLFVSNRKSSE